MNHKDTMKKLERLYDIAVENRDPIVGLEILNAMIRSGAAEASRRNPPIAKVTIRP